MLTAFPVQFMLYLCSAANLYEAATFLSPEGGRLIGVGLYLRLCIMQMRKVMTS